MVLLLQMRIKQQLASRNKIFEGLEIPEGSPKRTSALWTNLVD